MRKFRRLACCLGGGVLILAFQNCAKSQLNDPGQVTAASTQAGSVMVNPNITSQEEQSGISGSTFNKAAGARYVVPRAIEFGDRDTGSGLNLGYRLDVASGSVMSLDSKQVVGQLTAAEQAQLQSLLQDTVLANGEDLALEDGRMCAQVIKDAYANLLTDQGSFVIGAGTSSCVTDLYKIESHQSSGLKAFLAKISR